MKHVNDFVHKNCGGRWTIFRARRAFPIFIGLSVSWREALWIINWKNYIPVQVDYSSVEVYDISNFNTCAVYMKVLHYMVFIKP